MARSETASIPWVPNRRSAVINNALRVASPARASSSSAPETIGYTLMTLALAVRGQNETPPTEHRNAKAKLYHPVGLPDDDVLALPSSAHCRLLQRVHDPGTGQLSLMLGRVSPSGREAIRHPHPEVLQVLDPRPLLDEAASIGARYRTGGLRMTETLAAGLAHGRRLWF